MRNWFIIAKVPFAETIEICTETLYDGHLPTPVIPKDVFIELMKTCLLAIMNQSFFNKISKPTFYCSYVNDTFFFHKEIDFQKILTCLNSLHPTLKFINEIEASNSLPFWMYLLPNLIIDLSLQSIESLLLQVNLFIGIRLDQNNVKQILLIR